MARFEIECHGQRLPPAMLDSLPADIGRSRQCALHLEDPIVSRLHARVERQGGALVITDLGSKIGLFVNDKPAAHHRLAEGDRVTIGPFVLTFRTAAVVPEDEGMEVVEAAIPITGGPATGGTAPHDRFVTQSWQWAGGLSQEQTAEGLAMNLLGEAIRRVGAERGAVFSASGGDVWETIAEQPRSAAAVPCSTTLLRRIATSGQALLCRSVEADRQLRFSRSIQDLGAGSIAAVPILAGGRVVAALCLLKSRAASAFTTGDLAELCELCRASAGWLAALMEKQRTTELRRRGDLPVPILYRSAVMADLLRQATQAAATDATMMLLGPTGVGKELLATAVHYASLRAAGPLVKVNCAAIPETLIESELFGHERGAFTDAKTARQGHFERADGGTLFLDEIAEAPMSVQTKLLRVLEQRTIERVGGKEEIRVDVRVIAATHRDLPTMVAEGRFREDLWYRLEVVRLRLPPLCERTEDVPLLFRAFAEHQGRLLDAPPVELDDAAEQALMKHPWPGNVRQLRNLVERLAIFHSGQRLGAAEVMAALEGGAATAAVAAASDTEPIRPLREARLEFERDYIHRAMKRSGGNITRAAELLGVTRENLSRRLKQLDAGEAGDE